MPIQNRRPQEITIPITTSLATYAPGEVIGGLIEIPRLTSYLGGGGVLRKIILTDKDSQKPPLDIHVFSLPIVPILDGGVFALTLDCINCRIAKRSIAVPDWEPFGLIANQVILGSLDIVWQSASGSLYTYIVTGDAPHFTTANSLTMKLIVEIA